MGGNERNKREGKREREGRRREKETLKERERERDGDTLKEVKILRGSERVWKREKPSFEMELKNNPLVGLKN